jgi:hypothetical protein
MPEEMYYSYLCTSTILFTNTSNPSTHIATSDVKQGCHCYTARADGNVAFCIFFLLLFIFNFNWTDARWQWYSTRLHTNSTQNTGNGTYITIKRKNWEVWTVSRLRELYSGVCLTTEEKARKNLS